MVIQPKTRGFICTTSHPTGCDAHVKRQIDYAKQQPKIANAAKRVLVIGASTGYGLASRIVASFIGDADTIGVSFEKGASGKRTASAGWYNTAAFEKYATEAGYKALSLNGDAFSHEIKQQTIDLIKQELGQVDLIVYSLASPRRVHPDTGEVYNSALKTIGKPFSNKSVDPLKGEITQVEIGPANQEEINNTVAVMGGEDWQLWIDALLNADAIADGAKTLAYSYVGPELTFPIYREGTIGKAKEDLERTAAAITDKLNSLQGEAYVSINKAVVTQASAAIPVVPLYISLLFKVMKQKGLHEDCIEQIARLYHDFLYNPVAVPTDDSNRIRIDDWEMREDVQQAVFELWQQVTQDNLMDISDLAGYRKGFFNLFGFEMEGVDYEQDVDPVVAIPSIGVE
ncbi:MAG: enoyl-[acyl-carrier-protein] reductase FabV [Legionellales bacterium]|nr:enoyl-[acyl-carrier-protein] reductase FabV [Legionellales bacterium]